MVTGMLLNGYMLIRSSSHKHKFEELNLKLN